LPQARDTIQKSGYVVGTVRYGNDNDVGPDRVLRQEPAAGTPAPAGTPVHLVVNESE
jgi:beta-lactam-binding protein with PASTA domain